MTKKATAMTSSFEQGGTFACRDVGDPQGGKDPWSSDSITSDCAGHFKLCYALKAGDINKPETGCTIATTCVEAEYPMAGVDMPLPPLPGWIGTDTACMTKFMNDGGWADMTVIGTSYGCDKIDDGANAPVVFFRQPYCPLVCADHPDKPECKECTSDGVTQMF
jgi:hypothetical protein